MSTVISSGQRFWTLNLFLGLLLCLCFFTVFAALAPTLPLYIARQGASDWEIGLVIGAYGVAALVMRPISGRLTDQYGPKMVVVFGSLLFGITTALFPLIHEVPLLFILRLFHGIGLVFFFTASTTLVTNLVPPQRVGEAIGVLGVVGGIGWGVAPPVAVVLAEGLGFERFFLLGGLLGILAALVGLPISVKHTAPTQRGSGPAPLINRRAVFPALVFFAMTITMGPLYAFLPLFSIQRNLGNPGLFFTALNITGSVARPLLGRLSDQYGRPPIIIPGFLLVGVAMFVLATATSQTVLLLSGLLYGMGTAGVYVGLLSFTLDRVTVETRGSAIATYQWAWDLGSSGGSMLSGFLAGSVSYAAVFALSGASPLIGLAIFLMGLRREKATVRAASPS